MVIGMDGATFAVMDEFLEAGLLPNLAALEARGTAGTLETILPAISPPAWTSAITGVNPGKHNIFDFFHQTGHGPNAFLTSSRDRRAFPVWHFLNEDGWRTGIMNVPMTFPPDEVDGFFVSGFPFGQETTGYTYPASLENELKEAGPYPLDLFGESIRDGQEQGLLEHFRRTARRHGEEAVRLAREGKWDLFWAVFTGTDKVMHFYWKFADPEHPRHDPALAEQFGSAIREMFQQIDGIIGELVEIAGPETDILVISDHGMGPIYKELRLTNWMIERRFLVPPTQTRPGYQEAFPPGPFAGLVRVSQKDRDFGGQIREGAETAEVVDRLVAGIESLKDPDTGEPFAERVFRRDEVYDGPYAENGPDVLFQEKWGTFVGRRPNGNPSDVNDVFGLPSYSFSGFHRPDGILIAAGPRFEAREGRGSFSILDVAPTIYWLFDSEAPHDLDHDVPDGLVHADSLAAREPRIGSDRLAVELREVTGGGEPAIEALPYVE